MMRNHRFYDHQHDDAPPGGGGPPSGELDPAQESLSQALRAGFNVLRVIIVVLLVAYFLSGWFQVEPGEQGLIARFGKLRINHDQSSSRVDTPVFDEGWHPALPDPFDEKIRISGQTYKLKIYTFAPPLKEKEKQKELGDINLAAALPPKSKLTPGTDGAMLSGDRNLSHGLWAIEFRIDDAGKFVQNYGKNPRAFANRLLRRLAENAIVHTVAGMPVERIIRTRTDELAGDFTLAVKRRLSDELKALDLGVDVINVEAKTSEPGRVRGAFNRVTQAKSDRKKREDEAWQAANQILSKAAGPREKYEALLDAIDAYGAAQAVGVDDRRLEELRSEIDKRLTDSEGQVAVQIRRAQSRANEIRERVQQEYKLFVDYRNMYRKYPRLTVMRLWVRMRDAILSSKDNEIFFVPRVGELEIITNRDLQKVLDADVQRFRDRFKTQNKH